MDTNTLASNALTSTSVHAGSRNLSTLGFHEEHKVQLHLGAGVGRARVAQFILAQADICECVPFLVNRDNAT